jgi:hypothetical protein
MIDETTQASNQNHLRSEGFPVVFVAGSWGRSGSALVTFIRSWGGNWEQPVTKERCRPLSEVEVQALHLRVLAARDLDVDPDPRDLATVHRINADELAQFDRRLGT